jgi:hypothetical protein
LNQSNEQLEEYRQLIHLISGKSVTTNIDDLTHSDYSDDDSKPIEKYFCLDDYTENKFSLLYSKPPLPLDDNDEQLFSHLKNAIE